MADNAQLDSFLASGTPQEGAEAPDPLIDPQGLAKTQKPSEAAPEPPAKASEAKPEAEPAEEDIAPHTGADNRTVPFSALEKVRNDWKSKYAARDAEANLLRQQLEEAKRPPSPAPQVEPQQQQYVAPPPDPRVDPLGYIQYLEVQRQQELIQRRQEMLNERLNNSEERLRDKIGDEKLDEYVNEFKQMAARDETLLGKLYAQRHPYGWMQKEVERQRALRDVGDDPAAFRSKVEAELRAKWEAEMAQQNGGAGGNGHAASPVAGMPPSLANARSVAGRTAPAFTGPPPMEALFPGHNARREQRR